MPRIASVVESNQRICSHEIEPCTSTSKLPNSSCFSRPSKKHDYAFLAGVEQVDLGNQLVPVH